MSDNQTPKPGEFCRTIDNIITYGKVKDGSDLLVPGRSVVWFMDFIGVSGNDMVAVYYHGVAYGCRFDNLAYDAEAVKRYSRRRLKENWMREGATVNVLGEATIITAMSEVSLKGLSYVFEMEGKQGEAGKEKSIIINPLEISPYG